MAQSVIVESTFNGWTAYYSGDNGKRRLADFLISAYLDIDEIQQYLDDLFHESAASKHQSVKVI